MRSIAEAFRYVAPMREWRSVEELAGEVERVYRCAGKECNGHGKPLESARIVYEVRVILHDIATRRRGYWRNYQITKTVAGLKIGSSQQHWRGFQI